MKDTSEARVDTLIFKWQIVIEYVKFATDILVWGKPFQNLVNFP